MTHHHRRIGNATCFQAASPPAPPPPQGPGIRHISQGPGRAAPKTPGASGRASGAGKSTQLAKNANILVTVFDVDVWVKVGRFMVYVVWGGVLTLAGVPKDGAPCCKRALVIKGPSIAAVACVGVGVCAPQPFRDIHRASTRNCIEIVCAGCRPHRPQTHSMKHDGLLYTTQTKTMMV